MAEKKINCVTVEDPVEKLINGVTQVQVNAKAGLTFATALRSILRQYPDVIMVGEIRDEETADIGVRAAVTGHLVLSTLHTNDCVSAVRILSSACSEDRALLPVVAPLPLWWQQRSYKRESPYFADGRQQRHSRLYAALTAPDDL